MATGGKTGLSAALVMGGLALSTGAHAGAETGFYIGGGVGSASLEATDTRPGDGAKLNFDESDAAYKLFAGYNFGAIPFLNLALEAGYVDFGNPQGAVAGEDLSYDLAGFDGYASAGVTLGPVTIFAKAGVLLWDSDAKIGATTRSDSGSDAAYGAGIQFQLLSIGFRAEYERYDVGDFDALDMVSASISYTF